MTAPQKKPASSRREFLTGQAAADALLAAADRAPPPSDANDAQRSPSSYLFQIGRSAMACEFQVFLNAGQHAAGPDAALRALDLVDKLEDQMSVYRPHTEVSDINRRAAAGPVAVEPRLFALLQRARQLFDETGGAFDITSGPLSKVWGFSRRSGRMPSDDEIRAAREFVGGQNVELNSKRATIRFHQPGVEINLNAIGKGHALDRCEELLLAEDVDNFLIHGGQSSLLARGSRAGLAAGETGWSVALRHPLRPEVRLAEILMRDRALGTSGSGTQFFYHQGRRYGHILDPRTGWPADAVLSTTVLAPTAADADALATAFYVLGLDESRAYCAQHPEIAALIVTPGDRSGAADVHAIGLDDRDWKQLAQ